MGGLQPSSVASESSGNLIKIQILRFIPDLLNERLCSKTQKTGFHNPSRGFQSSQSLRSAAIVGFAYDFIQVRGRKVSRTCLMHTLFLHDIVRVHQAQFTSYIELLADISMLDFFNVFFCYYILFCLCFLCLSICPVF